MGPNFSQQIYHIEGSFLVLIFCIIGAHPRFDIKMRFWKTHWSQRENKIITIHVNYVTTFLS